MPMTGELAAPTPPPHIGPSPSAVAPARRNRDDWLIVGIAMAAILFIMLGGAMMLPLDPGTSQPVEIVGPS